MKKLFALLTILGVLAFGLTNVTIAQDEVAQEVATEEVAAEKTTEAEEAPKSEEKSDDSEESTEK